MDQRETRAERRRREWTFGVARSFAEMDQADLEFWLSATPETRVIAAWELAMDLSTWTANGDQNAAAFRLDRTVGGVRQRGR